MKFIANLDQFSLDPAVKSQVLALIEEAGQEALRQLRSQETELHNQRELLTAKDAEIARKDFKIEALTYELAYYKRIRFSTKSEALTALQRDVFEETWNTDLSAIEAEIEQLADQQPSDTVAKPKRARAGPAASRCRITCHVLNTATSQTAAPADSVAAT